jgi:hypothetical protein
MNNVSMFCIFFYFFLENLAMLSFIVRTLDLKNLLVTSVAGWCLEFLLTWAKELACEAAD